MKGLDASLLAGACDRPAALKPGGGMSGPAPWPALLGRDLQGFDLQILAREPLEFESTIAVVGGGREE